MRSSRVVRLVFLLLLAAALPLSAAPAGEAVPNASAVVAPDLLPEPMVDEGATALLHVTVDVASPALERTDTVTALPALTRQPASVRPSRQPRHTFQHDAVCRHHLHRYSASHRPRDTSAFLTRSRT